MEQSHKTDRRMALVGVAVVVIVIAAIVVASVLLFGSTKKETESNSAASPTPTPTVATKDEVQQSLTNLDETMTQAAADQDAAKSAIKDGTDQVKVAN